MPFQGTLREEEMAALEFDLFVGACGYESRAIHLPSVYGPRARERLACRFPSQRVLAYKANEEFFSKNGYQFLDASDASFRGALLANVAEVFRLSERLRMFVDISSQSRGRLADIVDVMQTVASDQRSLE